MNRFAKMYNPRGLRIPERPPKARAVMRAVSSFQGPKELILTGYCTPAENQGAMPYCAAYAASSFAENVKWRLNGYHRDIDPVPLYKYAKTIDGDPDGDGTYLECALEALLAKGHFDKDVCSVKVVRGSLWGGVLSGFEDLQYVVHRYGSCIAGFEIDSSWYTPKGGVVYGGGATEGGHAVTVAGYDEDGVIVLNSWGADYGHDGFVYIPRNVFAKQFLYAAVLTHCLDDR